MLIHFRAMRFLASLVLCSAAVAPAAAGTVSAVSFGQNTDAEKVVLNGVEATNAAGFTVYQHGIWRAPTLAASSSAVAVAVEATPPEPPPFTSSPPSSLLAGDACASRELPSRAGLSSKAFVGRLTYWPLVRDAECRHRLPGGLLDALIWQESRYQLAAVSRAGAAGLAQLMPGTAADLGVRNRFDPIASLDAGARYLRSMLDRYRSVPVALAAYNAGMGSVNRAGGIPLNRETPGYVRSILGFWNQDFTASRTSLAVSRAVSLSFTTSSPE